METEQSLFNAISNILKSVEYTQAELVETLSYNFNDTPRDYIKYIVSKYYQEHNLV